MGFLKKLSKKISLKNLVKVTALASSFIPGVGGVAGKIITKASTLVGKHKEAAGILRGMAHKSHANGNSEAAKQQMAMADSHDQQADVVEQTQAAAKKNPGIMEILGGAAEGAGHVLASGESGAKVTNSFMDSAIVTWAKEHWWMLAGGLAALWFALKHFGGHKPKRRAY